MALITRKATREGGFFVGFGYGLRIFGGVFTLADLLPASRHFRPFWRAYKLWLRLDCVDLSAAFAYHSLQSLFPMVLIAMSLASKLLGRDEGLYERLIDLVSDVLPVTVMPAFSATLSAFLRQGFGAGVLGVVALVLTASNAYLTLQRGADRLWWNRPFGFEGLPWKALVLRYVQLRLKAFGLVSLFALLIVVDQTFTNMRLLGSSGLRNGVLALWPWAAQVQQPVSWGLDLVIALALAIAASLLLLWVLPSRRIPWKPLLPGALLIGVSLTFLNLVLGRVLVTLGVRFQAYGLVGGVLVLSLWVWLVGVILYYGQCLCVVLDRPTRVRMEAP